MLDQVDPRLMERARKARTQYRDLYWVRLPLIKPIREKYTDRDRKRSVEHHEWDFLFRALNKDEYEQFAKDAALCDITEPLIRSTLLFPKTKKWTKNPIHRIAPGVFEGLRDMVIEVSGYGDQKALYQGLGFGRSEGNNIYGAITAFICKAFPSMKPFEVQKLTWLEQARLVAMAEIALGGEFPLQEMLQPKRERTSWIPTADEWHMLPRYTPEQLESIRKSSPETASLVEVAAAREEARMSGLGERKRAEKMAQLAQQRAAEMADRMKNF